MEWIFWLLQLLSGFLGFSKHGFDLPHELCNSHSQDRSQFEYGLDARAVPAELEQRNVIAFEARLMGKQFLRQATLYP